jgi:hypothetical protein
VREGARVIGSDGSVGKVIEVLVGDEADERYLGVRTGGLFGRDRYVAAYDVRQAAEDIVWLRISRRDVLTTTARAPARARRAERRAGFGPRADGVGDVDAAAWPPRWRALRRRARRLGAVRRARLKERRG